MSPLRAPATIMPIGPNSAGPPRCTSNVTVEPSPLGFTLPISFTLTPPLPSPSSVIASGGLKFTIVHLTRFGMPLTSTMDSMTVPLSKVSGSLLRHTRWMVSQSEKRERSDAQFHAVSGGNGTSTETESLAIRYVLGPDSSSTAFLAASCTLSTVSLYLPCVLSSTMSPALSIAASTLSAFCEKRPLTLSMKPISSPFHPSVPAAILVGTGHLHNRRRSPITLPCTHHDSSTAAAPSSPIVTAAVVRATFDGSSITASRPEGRKKITTYANPDAATSPTRHQLYGRATTASTHTATASIVIS